MNSKFSVRYRKHIALTFAACVTVCKANDSHMSEIPYPCKVRDPKSGSLSPSSTLSAPVAAVPTFSGRAIRLHCGAQDSGCGCCSEVRWQCRSNLARKPCATPWRVRDAREVIRKDFLPPSSSLQDTYMRHGKSHIVAVRAGIVTCSHWERRVRSRVPMTHREGTLNIRARPIAARHRRESPRFKSTSAGSAVANAHCWRSAGRSTLMRCTAANDRRQSAAADVSTSVRVQLPVSKAYFMPAMAVKSWTE